MKKKTLLLLIAVTALLTVGITIAFMFRKTGSIRNEFIPAKVSCSVVEEFDDVQKTSIKVKNDSNISCYLRVRLVSYWQNAKGEIVGKSSKTPSISVGNDWLADVNNDTYYYKQPVGVGEVTATDLLTEPLVLETDEFNGETVYQVVEVFAEAVQAEPDDAVKAAWPSFKTE